MTTKNTVLNRLLSILLCLALMVSYLPASTLVAKAADTDTRVADPSTMDNWRPYFLPENGDLSTENAGGIWTDKSVLTSAGAFSGTGITMDTADQFLVALSAMASNKTITGMSNVPTDTMLVLDVSGSMNDNQGNNDVAEELVEAANESIAALLATNDNSRVGVVLYSGPDTVDGSATASDAILLLPLGRYVTGSDGQYLSYTSTSGWNSETTEYIGLSDGIAIEGNTDGNIDNDANRKEVVGATYLQKGIIEAMSEFKAQTSVTVQDSVLGTIQRKPILVLMSDGAPTIADTDFTAPGAYDMGRGNATSEAMGFVNQLSAAYAKQQIEAKYGTDALFFTLGLGIDNDNIATSVMDPASHASSSIDTYWSRYDAAATGGTISLPSGQDNNGPGGPGGGPGSSSSTVTVTKIAETLEQEYVDQYFSVGSGTDLAEGLKQAFKDIVGAIQLQSQYYPTLVEDSHELSGYISFVDRIGQYMQVTDIKGILINDTLYSGATLASNFVTGGGNLGTTQNPTALGDELVWSIMERLNISSADEVRTLINLAYQNGQISYTNANNFSNYIGWYSNAAGDFLGFWHEGITTMPDPSDPSLTDATRPAFINKSYFFLGAVDESHGVDESDLMYATIRVREEIATGEQSVAFAVPAALIPVITYEVSLDENNEVSELVATGASEPIRLVYSLAMDPDIDEYTISSLVSQEYIDANSKNGAVNFYTNQYEADGSTGYGTVNTYSYFYPSRQNERFYYQSNAPVYNDANGNLYTGSAQPSGVKYRSYTVYKKTGSSYSTETVYRRLSDDALSTAQYDAESNTWYIAKGNVHVNLDGFTAYKGGLTTYDASQNHTDTLDYAGIPYVDTNGHDVNDLGYNFIVGTTLGNNGRISIQPATGIKLSKALAAGAAAAQAPFTFTLENLTNTADSSAYPARLISAAGTQSDTTVQFAGGTAQVQLEAGQSLYISGMTAGQIIRITEQETADYMVETVNGAAGNAVELTLVAQNFVEADYVNAERGKGNLTISKVVEHDFGTDAPELTRTFQITVTLAGIGTAGATFQATHTDASGVMTATTVTTDANGQFVADLAQDEQLELHDLPAGTVATVVEQEPGTGFTPSYYDNGQAGDGIVTIGNGMLSSVIVLNDYSSTQVSPVYLAVEGVKVLTGRDWLATDSFTFLLQRYNSDDTWTQIGNPVVLNAADMAALPLENQEVPFNFNGTLTAEVYDQVGTYYYRVIEQSDAVSVGGLTYDKTVHAFAVDVSDSDWDGKLEIVAVRAYRPETTIVTSSTDGNGDIHWNVEVDFTNTYAVNDNAQATVAIDLNKLVVNPSGSPLALPSGFTFGLYDESGALAFTSAATTDRGFARLVMTYKKADLLEGETRTLKYTLKEIVSGAAAGWTYSQQEYAVTVVLTDENDGTMSAVIYFGEDGTGADTDISADFTNTYTPGPAELEINFVEKELSGRDMEAGEFKFAVYANTDTQRQNPLSIGTNDAQGKVTFDRKLTFDTVGTFYFDIIETTGDGNGIVSDKNTYRVTVIVTDGGQGQLVAAHTLVNAEGSTIIFRNTYTTTAANVVISGNKVLNGRYLMNDEFTFLLHEASLVGGELTVGSKIDEAKNWNDGSFHFSAIEFTKAGTYYYVVSEQAGDDSLGVRYDGNRFVITVTVTDDGNGTLTASWSSAAENGGSAPVEFVNDYIPSATQAQISGNKTLEGKLLSSGTYSFELYASNDSWAQLDKLQTVTNSENGAITFTAISYDKAGDYYYLVKEVNGGSTIDGVIYDDTIYRVHIAVTDNLRGQLVATTSITDQNDMPHDRMQFVNIYRIVGNDTVVLNGVKTLVGADLGSREFTFELYEADSFFSIGARPLDTQTNSGESFSFQLHYDHSQVGQTYYYLVKEADAGQTIDGITYSLQEFYITVSVLDDGVGGMETTATIINQSDTNVSYMDFVNHYNAEPVSLDLSGEKHLNIINGDRVLNAEEFSFSLYASDAAWAQGIQLQTVYNAADGSFAFETMELTEAKLYHFLVVEDPTPVAGVENDGRSYRILVDVQDDGEGNLYIASITDEQGDPVQILFENVYTAEPATLALSGRKNLENKDLVGNDFSFGLYASNDSWRPVSLVQSVSNKADGTFAFDELQFQNSGEFRFVILENSEEAKGGIVYDQSQYRIRVLVTDDLEGQLVAQIISIKKFADGQETDVTDIVLNNRYETKSTHLDLSGMKDLTGRDLDANEFSFELYNANERFAIYGQALQTVYNAADGTFAFQAVELTEAKTYHFVVKENSRDALPGVKYDGSEYRITVVVEDDGNGNLVIRSNTMVRHENAREEDASSILFRNEYSANSTSVNLTVNKKLNGRDLAAGEFTFLLQEVGSDAEPMKAVNNADGSVTFGALTFDKAGTYEYRIYEDTTVDVERVTFDNTVYIVRIVVTDAGQGQLIASEPEISAEGIQGPVLAMQFVNTYIPRPDDIAVPLAVQKTVENRGFNKIGPDGFRFLLKNETTGEENILVTDEQGNASISLGYTELDQGKTYTYTLSELNDGMAHVTYSDKVYSIQVRIELNTATNKLEAQLTVDGAQADALLAAFTNIYDYTPDPGTVEVELAVNKIVENLGFNKIGPDGFRFLLKNVETGEEKILVTNENGKTSVLLTYGKADVGKHTYTLSEINDGMAHVTYSDKVYTIEVDVSVNDNNELVAVKRIDGITVDTVVGAFTNIYDYTPDPGTVEVELAVNKIVENLGFNKIGPNGFRFLLKNVETGEEKILVTNENGKASVLLTYGKADVGKHTYTLSEINDGAEHVTYSDRVYNIVVEVSVNENNELVAYRTVDGVTVSQILTQFTNIYDYTPDPGTVEVEFAVNKTVENLGFNKIGVEGFRFLLKNEATGEEKILVTNENGKASVLLTYGKADVGKHTYTLSEINDGMAYVTYSDKVYTIEVDVSVNDNNELVAVKHVDGINVGTVVGSFTNIYDYTPAPGTVEVEFAVNKTVENLGFNKIGVEGFRFLLKNEATGEEKILVTNENGEASVLLTYGKADVGKHTYTLSEINDGMAHVTYSDKVYTIEVDVSVNDNNELVAVKRVDGINVGTVVGSFTNIYDYTPDPGTAQVVVSVDKIVHNIGSERIGAKGFRFLLKNEITGQEQILVADEAGKASVILNFEKANVGKHTYTLSEINDGAEHVTYSDKIYIIEVEVSVNENNELVAQVLLDNAPAEAVAAVFENTYDYTPELPPVPDNPDTGDAGMFLWVALLFVSGGCFTALSILGKKKEEQI